VLGRFLHEPYDLMQIVWSRYATHLALMLAIFAWSSPSRLWRTRRPALQLGRSFLMLVMPGAFALSLAVGAGSDLTWSLFWIAPILTLWLARRLLGERVAASLWVCAALVAVAALLVHPPRPPASIAQVALPIVMSLSFALYLVATRMLRDEPFSANLFYTALVAFVLLTPVMPFVWHMPTLHDVVVLMGIGGVGLVALALLDRSVHEFGVSIVAPVIGLEVPFATMLRGLHGGPAGARELVAIALLAGICFWLWRSGPGLGAAPGDAAGAPRAVR
jgi:drug/metabolite transporter (DMT)-like permease